MVESSSIKKPTCKLGNDKSWADTTMKLILPDERVFMHLKVTQILIS